VTGEVNNKEGVKRKILDKIQAMFSRFKRHKFHIHVSSFCTESTTLELKTTTLILLIPFHIQCELVLNSFKILNRMKVADKYTRSVL